MNNENLKKNYTGLTAGFFLLKDLNDYIISKIQIEAFLNIHFSKKDIVFSVSAISNTRKPMKYSFSFEILECFFENSMSPDYFFTLVDRYIKEINDYFRDEYLK